MKLPTLLTALLLLNQLLSAAEPAGGVLILIDLLNDPGEDREKIIRSIDEQWDPTFLAGIYDIVRLVDRETADELFALATRKTGVGPPFDHSSLGRWIWERPANLDVRYADFKAKVYGRIDERFTSYFSDDRITTVRLDEIVWGGVRQNGIPPLRGPQMLVAEDAVYLHDSDVVFGVELNGDARAYPKRILGWHEMLMDTVGGIPFAGVYCTLCGSFIGYRTQVGETHHTLGTSGFLYRSNKLIFDEANQSLWNTLTGEPVVGPLVGKGIKLERLPVVTSTWGEWRRRHPGTTVLSLDTGHKRDYSEDASYGDYWATDELMFDVPIHDLRLKNKDEVLAILPREGGSTPIAISHEFLLRTPMYETKAGSTQLLVLTDISGAHRVYDAGNHQWKDWDLRSKLQDMTGEEWIVSESAIRSSTGEQLDRYPSHNSFWFGWINAFTNTKLIR